MHLKAFLSRSIDGLIVMDAYRHIPDRCFYDLAEEGVPVVLVERDIDDPSIPTVHIDDYDGMRAAVTHLITEHGHNRIAYISGPAETRPTKESLRAYSDALSESGIDFDPRLVVEGDWLSSSGHIGMAELLTQRLPVTAVCAANDAMALGAMRAVADFGLRVPDDIAVMGFDNMPVLAPHTQPALSTVDYSLYKVGRVAAQLLHKLINGEPCPSSVVVPVDLVIRESCGCKSPNKRIDCRELEDSCLARGIQNNVWISLKDQIVTAVWGDAFYVRNGKGMGGPAGGLGVSYEPAVSSVTLSPGDIASVSGRLTTIRGRKMLGDPYIQVTGRADSPKPVEVRLSDLSENGEVATPGALVATSGRAIVASAGAIPRNFEIAGADGARVHVWNMEIDGTPKAGDAVRVVGIWETDPDQGTSILAVRIRPA